MTALFWVGGTGTWDNAATTHWSTSSGGANGAGPPAATDTVTFDGSSGGGTVTVAATINASNTLVSLTCGAFTGTLDFSANNPSITMGTWSSSGAGTRTINLGSGTFTITATTGTVWDNSTITNLTFNANTSTIDLNATGSAARSFAGGTKTYNNVTVTNSVSDRFPVSITGTSTIANVTFTNVRLGQFGSGFTITITGALTFNGTSTSQAILTGSTNTTNTTLSLSGANTLNWIAVQGVTKSGAGSLTVNNGFDAGGNTLVTINPPPTFVISG